jgi:hypothetical protein
MDRSETREVIRVFFCVKIHCPENVMMVFQRLCQLCLCNQWESWISSTIWFGTHLLWFNGVVLDRIRTTSCFLCAKLFA